jgi:hypothetical protein
VYPVGGCQHRDATRVRDVEWVAATPMATLVGLEEALTQADRWLDTSRDAQMVAPPVRASSALRPAGSLLRPGTTNGLTCPDVWRS